MHACARRGAAVEAITHQGRLEVAPQAKLLLASLPSPPPLLPIAGVCWAFGPPHCRSIGPAGDGGARPGDAGGDVELPRIRHLGHCRFRNRGTEYHSKPGM
jgi:hypothetical protein